MNRLDYSVRSREVVSLINDLNGGQLILKSYFQRNLVWRDIHKKEFIDTILSGLPFPQIFLARGGINVDSLQSFSCVVDGQQRLSAIRDFAAGDFDVDGRYFADLSQNEKEQFLKYEVAVIDFDLEPDDPRLNDIFQRLNRTYYSLSSVEKLSAEYAPSDLMVTAKTLIGEFKDQEDIDGDLDDGSINPFNHDPNVPPSSIDWAMQYKDGFFADLMLSEKIFSLQDTKRKIPLMATLNIICSHMDKYYNRNNDIKRQLDKYKDNLDGKDQLTQSLDDIAEIIFIPLKQDSVWLNKANFFTVCVETLNAKISRDRLGRFRKLLESVEEKGLPFDYQLAAREGVNNTKERELRGTFVRQLIEEHL